MNFNKVPIRTTICILASLLLTVACKKDDPIGHKKDLLVRKITTILDERQGDEPFVSIKERLFDYDNNGRLHKVSEIIIHKHPNRADTIKRGYDEFLHDQTGRLIRRNHCNDNNVVVSYREFTYNSIGLPELVSVYSAEWDPVTSQLFYQQSGYDEYVYDDARLIEKTTHYRRNEGNNMFVMLPVLRWSYHYDPAGNIVTADAYPLSEMYGTIGELVAKDEYQYAQQGRDPMFFGQVYSSLYTDGNFALSLNSFPLVSQKRTVLYHTRDWPETYQTADFIIETGSHGYPEKILETYALETYTRLPNVERPTLLTERFRRESRFEYIDSGR